MICFSLLVIDHDHMGLTYSQGVHEEGLGQCFSTAGTHRDLEAFLPGLELFCKL
jgi:hypothetical protein